MEKIDTLDAFKDLMQEIEDAYGHGDEMVLKDFELELRNDNISHIFIRKHLREVVDDIKSRYPDIRYSTLLLKLIDDHGVYTPKNYYRMIKTLKEFEGEIKGVLDTIIAEDGFESHVNNLKQELENYRVVAENITGEESDEDILDAMTQMPIIESDIESKEGILIELKRINGLVLNLMMTKDYPTIQDFIGFLVEVNEVFPNIIKDQYYSLSDNINYDGEETDEDITDLHSLLSNGIPSDSSSTGITIEEFLEGQADGSIPLTDEPQEHLTYGEFRLFMDLEEEVQDGKYTNLSDAVKDYRENSIDAQFGLADHDFAANDMNKIMENMLKEKGLSVEKSEEESELDDTPISMVESFIKKHRMSFSMLKSDTNYEKTLEHITKTKMAEMKARKQEKENQIDINLGDPIDEVKIGEGFSLDIDFGSFGVEEETETKDMTVSEYMDKLEKGEIPEGTDITDYVSDAEISKHNRQAFDHIKSIDSDNPELDLAGKILEDSGIMDKKKKDDK